ncbi:MAG TPA: M23 family metallopeptidase [Sphingomonadaceae bacterium]|nr:M23 family metallopeptidase [Sphingomonadaceae bacterium]
MTGQGGGAAALTLDRGSPDVSALRLRNPLGHDWRERLADLDLVVDLGARIGSREWFRGLATCTALCAAALAFTPSFGPLPAHSTTSLPPAQWAEARALAISPLAYGADTGRRMAPTAAVEPLTETPERPSINLVATLGQGDGFARALERAGVAKDEAATVAEIVARAISLGDLKAGTRMDVTLGRRPNKAAARPLDHLAFRARFDLKLAVARVDGALVLQRTPIAVDNTPLRVQGRVGSSLYASARAAGAPAGAVQNYIRALSTRMAVNRDIRADDRFDLIIEQRRAETGEVETGDLLYAGLDQGKKETRLLKWASGGTSQWFEASGVGRTHSGMTKPVAGRQTSAFGLRRHPILGFSRFHKGVDFGAPYGSPIVAATAGVVEYAGRHGGHGNYVKLRHGGGMETGYAHMSRIAAKVGQRVRQGQIIGYVGSTGLSTGPHLHYEVYRNGTAINPLSVKFTSTERLAGSELARFKATLSRLLTVPTATAIAAHDKKPGEDHAEAATAKPGRG